MIRFEGKKLLDKKVLIVFIVLLLLNISNIISLNIHEVTSQFYQGKKEIIECVEGVITQEKVTFLFEGLAKNTELVNAGMYDSENGDENTYTGFIYGDMAAFEEVYTDLKRVYDYRDMVAGKLVILEENIERANQANLGSEGFGASYSGFVKNQLEDRAIVSYYDTEGLECYFDYAGSYLFICIFLVFTGINYLYYDRKYDMEKTIYVTSRGRFQLQFMRYSICSVFALIVSVIFLLSDYLCFWFLYDIKGLHNPMYSLSDFAFTSLNISIAAYILLQAFLKIVSVLCINSLMLFLSKKMKVNYVVVVFCFLTTLILWRTFYTTEGLLSIYELSKEFSVHKICGFYAQDIHGIGMGLSLIWIIMSGLYLRRGAFKE